jgi:hypothetical protein
MVGGRRWYWSMVDGPDEGHAFLAELFEILLAIDALALCESISTYNGESIDGIRRCAGTALGWY